MKQPGQRGIALAGSIALNASIVLAANITLAAALAFGAAISAAPAAAQQARQEQRPQGNTEHTTRSRVSGDMLDRFAYALDEINVIRKAAAVRMERAADLEQAYEVQQEAQAEMIDAVRAAGLTVDEYNHIATLVSSDPQLANQVRARLKNRS